MTTTVLMRICVALNCGIGDIVEIVPDIPKGKKCIDGIDRFPEYKQKGNRHFRARGYYVDTVGRNEEQIRKYIAD